MHVPMLVIKESVTLVLGDTIIYDTILIPL